MANAISEVFKLVKPIYRDFPWRNFTRKISLAAMQEGFVTVSRNMAKAISEVLILLVG